jgi:hypothetical protein
MRGQAGGPEIVKAEYAAGGDREVVGAAFGVDAVFLEVVQ